MANGTEIRTCNTELDQRKRKRMQSNRESARRSRMKKQKRLDDLTAEIARIGKENEQIRKSINVTKQMYGDLESANLVLTAQMTELTQRLRSLGEIVNCIDSAAVGGGSGGGARGGGGCLFEAEGMIQGGGDGYSSNLWNMIGPNQYVIINSAAETFDY